MSEIEDIESLFGSCFFKLFYRIIFENTKNTILMLSKFSPCFFKFHFNIHDN